MHACMHACIRPSLHTYIHTVRMRSSLNSSGGRLTLDGQLPQSSQVVVHKETGTRDGADVFIFAKQM